MKKKIWSDPAFEEKAKSDLETSRQSLQACLDIWNSFDLTPCTDIFRLIVNPQKVYADAVNQFAEPPVLTGKFQLKKDVFVNLLDVPIPDSLYRAARDARKNHYTNIPELWKIVKDGKAIIIDKDESGRLIDSRSIYVNTPEQEKFVEAIVKYIETTNEISEILELLIGRPCEHQFFLNKPFRITQKSFPGPFQLELVPEKLRELLH